MSHKWTSIVTMRCLWHSFSEVTAVHYNYPMCQKPGNGHPDLFIQCPTWSHAVLSRLVVQLHLTPAPDLSIWKGKLPELHYVMPSWELVQDKNVRVCACNLTAKAKPVDDSSRTEPIQVFCILGVLLLPALTSEPSACASATPRREAYSAGAAGDPGHSQR